MAAAARSTLALNALALLAVTVGAPLGSCAAGSGGCAATTAAEGLSRDGAGTEQTSLSLLQDSSRKGGISAGGLSVLARGGANASAVKGGQCPPPQVKPVANFDVNEWIRKSWFAIEQVPVVFQPEPLECVTATYNLATPVQKILNVPGFCGDIILVSNWQKNGAAELCGSVVAPRQPSAIKVGPCFLPFPRVFAGDYWVIHVVSNPDGTYRWGLVSSGPPEDQAADGCVNKAGTWIFSRTPKMDPADLAEAKKTLRRLGYSLSALKKVKQAGCTYEGAPLK